MKEAHGGYLAMSMWFQGSSSRRSLAPAVVVCVGVGLSLLAFNALRNKERQVLAAQFERAADDRISAVARELEGDLHSLQFIERFFAGSEKVERDEFRVFVEPYTSSHPCLQAVEWIPRVLDAERAAYEEAAKKAFPDFQITEQGAQGRMIPAKRRPEYFPVYYVEPYAGNESALGFDLGSDPTRLEALTRARDTGHASATASITIVQETADQSGISVFLPLYRKGAPTDSIQDRRENLEGFALTVCRTTDLIETALNYLEPQGIDIHLYDMSPPVGERLLYFHPSRMRSVPGAPAPDKETLQRSALCKVETLEVADREWSVVCTATPQFVAAGRGREPWGVLATGLFITGVLATYLVGIAAGAARLTASTMQLEREVARRRHAEDDVRLLAQFPEENPNPVLRVDPVGTIVYANRASDPLLKMWGCSIGQPLPDALQRTFSDARRSSTALETEIECGDRVSLWMIAPIGDGDCAYLYGRDVTEQNAMDRALRDSEAWVKAVMDTAIDGIVTVDDRGIVETFNASAEDIFGYAAHEVIGNSLAMLMPSPHREHHEEYIDRYLRTGEAKVLGSCVEVLGRRKDGTTVPIELTVSNVLLGNRRAFTGIIRDITERKRTEEVMVLHSCALAAAANAIVIADREGSITWVNPAFARITGFSVQEAVGRSTSLLKSGEQDRAVYKELWQTITSGKVWHGEIINRRRDGTLYTEEMTITPVRNDSGDITHFIAIKQDITDRKQAQEERLRLIQVEHERNRLKEAVAAQEQLLGVVGHELRTPLAALRATSEYLLTEDARQTDEWDSFLQSINDETIRMANMVDNLLEAAQLNSGTVRWNWGTVRLKEVCHTAIDGIRPLVDAANVHLECCVETANLTMNGDADAIYRLVLNLVSNSHKHTAEGSIRVTVRRVDEPQEPRIEIAVQDTGEGIAQHLADRLGTAFALNAGIAGASYTKGTGLGLAICKGIVAAHGGTMSIKSAQGQGTTVTVRLRTDLAEAVADTADLTIKREIAA